MKHKLHFKKLTLRKDLNLFQAVMVGVGITIGAGIYVLLGPASALAGNAIWISFIISAVAFTVIDPNRMYVPLLSPSDFIK